MSVPLKLVIPAPSDWAHRLQARARRFGDWWVGQLLAMLPTRMRQWPALKPDELQLLLKDDGVEVTVTAGAERRAVAIFDMRDGQTPAGPLRAFLRQKTTDRTRVALALPREKLLICSLTLPAAAKENLRQVLGYEMDRHTPFTEEQVCFDYRVSAATADQIEVRLYVATREAVNQALRLAGQLGLRPHAIGITGEMPQPPGAAPLNLLPPADRPPRYSRRQMLDAGLGVVIVLLLAATVAIPFWHQSRRIALLDTELDLAHASAEAAFAVRDQRDALLAALDRIRDHRQASPPIIQTLDELSARLPDNTWVQRIEIKSGVIQLQGESTAASTLIRILEDSPLLEGVSFRSPVTQDPRSGQEHFQISARLGKEETP